MLNVSQSALNAIAIQTYAAAVDAVQDGVNTNAENVSTHTNDIALNVAGIQTNVSLINAVTSTANAAMPKAGGTFTGDVTLSNGMVANGTTVVQVSIRAGATTLWSDDYVTLSFDSLGGSTTQPRFAVDGISATGWWDGGMLFVRDLGSTTSTLSVDSDDITSGSTTMFFSTSGTQDPTFDVPSTNPINGVSYGSRLYCWLHAEEGPTATGVSPSIDAQPSYTIECIYGSGFSGHDGGVTFIVRKYYAA